MVEVKSLLAGCALLGFLLTACSRSKPVLPPPPPPSLETSLWDCMEKRNLACMDTVMRHGANLNLVKPDDELRYKMTPLHAAVNLGRPKIVRWLRENGAGLYFRDQNGNFHAGQVYPDGVWQFLPNLDFGQSPVRNAVDIRNATAVSRGSPAGYD